MSIISKVLPAMVDAQDLTVVDDLTPVQHDHLQGELLLNGQSNVLYLGEANRIEWLEVTDTSSGTLAVDLMGPYVPTWEIHQVGNLIATGTLSRISGADYAGTMMKADANLLIPNRIHIFTLTVESTAMRKFTFVPRYHGISP